MLLILGAILVIVSLYHLLHYSEGGRKFTIGGIYGIIGIIIICCFYYMKSNRNWTQKEIFVSETYIVSLADGQQVSGKGSMFYISINTDNTYSYYYQQEDGGYRRATLMANNTTIYEKENCTEPKIEFYNIEKTNQPTEVEEWLVMGELTEVTGTINKVYVPKGSIVRDFKLDAQ